MVDLSGRSERERPWYGVAPVLAVAGLVLFGLGGLLGLTRIATGLAPLTMSLMGAGLSALALVLGLVALARGNRRRARRAVPVAVIAPAVVIAFWLRLGGGPGINDVTTDLADPPRLVTTAGEAVPFPEATKATHREAYGDLTPLVTSLPPRRVLASAASVVRQGEKEGLALVAVDEARGEVRATATSGVFAFIDDVTIRVRPESDGGARVDVRSRSREGRGDLGVNAGRIRRILRELANRLASEL